MTGREARIRSLRGRGRWTEALELVGDAPLIRADILNEQALFSGSEAARVAAARELDRAEARLEMERGRVLHATFLSERGDEDPAELAHFEAALAAARRAEDPLLDAWSRFWIGIVHQVIRDDQDAALPHFEAAYAAAKEHGSAMLASYAVRHLAFAWDATGRPDDAWRGFEESVALRRAERFWPGVAAGLLTLAEVADERGRPRDARRYLRQSIAAAKRSGAVAFLARAESLRDRLDQRGGA